MHVAHFLCYVMQRKCCYMVIVSYFELLLGLANVPPICWARELGVLEVCGGGGVCVLRSLKFVVKQKYNSVVMATVLLSV